MEDQLLQFKQKYVEEAARLLEDLERDAMLLENNTEDIELIENVFRCMHTLKGTSSMYGFDNIAEITHHLENIYDLVRYNELSINSQLIEITLISADYVKSLLNANDKVSDENLVVYKKLVASIQKILDNPEIKKETKTERKKRVVPDTGFVTWQITFNPEESIITRRINLIYTFGDLFALGNYHIIQNEPFEDTTKFTIFVYTDKPYSDIEDALIFIMDYCKITRIANFDIFDDEALLKHKTSASNPTVEVANVIDNDVDDYILEEQNFLTDGDRSKNTNISKVRIGVEAAKLDELMYLVSELITSNSQLVLASKNPVYDPIRPIFEKIDKLSKLFRNNTLSLRLVPINEMVIRFQRLVRSLANQLGKEVELITQGTETELDKSTIDALADPLMHIIRNSLDHGIETPEEREENNKLRKGTIKITSYLSGNFVFIQIQDDGKGLDTEKIRSKAIEKGLISEHAQLSEKEIHELIFKPGFSTSETVTQVSGRGVGMDVVRKSISELRGEIEISSEKGLGTIFTIKLHQTIAILDTMLFQIGDMFFMVPLSDVEECRLVEHSELELRKNSNTVEYSDHLIPYVDLYKLFKLPKNENAKNLKMLVINRQDNYFAFAADRIIGEHQAVLKTLGEAAKKQSFISVASVLGDGNLAYLLDLTSIDNLIQIN